MNQSRNLDEIQGRRDLGNWDERSPDAPRLDRITESLAEMYTRGQEPVHGGALATPAGPPVSGHAFAKPAGHEWAGNSRESITAMLNTMSFSDHGTASSGFDLYESGEVPSRKNSAVILAGIFVGLVTIGIAGYGFYLLGQKDAIPGAPEMSVAKMAPEAAKPEKIASATDLAVRKDLSRIEEGEKAHLASKSDAATPIAPVMADSAASLKTDLQPVEALKAGRESTGAGVELEPAKKDMAEATRATADEGGPVRREAKSTDSGPATSDPRPADANPGGAEADPAIKSQGVSKAPPASGKTTAKAEAAPMRADKASGLSEKRASTVPAPSDEAVKTPVLSENLAVSEKPAILETQPVSLDSLSKSVVLAMVALGAQPKKAVPGVNPAAVLRERMTRLVAEAARQGKQRSDVELMLEHALAGVPGDTIPDVLKDAQGKVNVKMLLSSITPVDTGR